MLFMCMNKHLRQKCFFFPRYVAGIKASVAYANAHGIEVGGYDLIALSRGGTGYDTIDPLTGKCVSCIC